MESKGSSSGIKELVKFLASVRGDLANITAPPRFLAPSSVVEVGQCWAQRPAVFAAPALEPSAEKRSLLVLRLVLIALRSELYVAGSPTVSIKKPLNPFLGELFLARWNDGETDTSTRLVAEQVSHHPPITAMHIRDEDNGVRADGYARVESTFSGTVDVKQVGHAIYHIDRHDEDYLIPLPDVTVRGFMSRQLYPEVSGTYHISASTGYVSEIQFNGAGLAWGTKNSFTARMYHKDEPKKTLYEVSGVWSQGWKVQDARTGELVEDFDLEAPENAPATPDMEPLEDQDPWESRRAWASVRTALLAGDYRTAAAEKSKVEQAQRAMRADERKRGKAWKPLLFKNGYGEDHEVFHRLAEGFNWQLHDDKTKGVWRVNEDKVEGVQRPFHRELSPLGP